MSAVIKIRPTEIVTTLCINISIHNIILIYIYSHFIILSDLNLRKRIFLLKIIFVYSF